MDLGSRRAIALFERCGYEREGLKRHSRIVEAIYADELCVAKLIDAVVPEAGLEPARP